MTMEIAATLTLTPTGVEPAAERSVGMAALTQFSSGNIQKLDKALRRYSGSKNSLINVSADLLALCGTIKRMQPEDDLNIARLELTRAIIDLKYKVVQFDYPPSVAENLCLLFAIVLDEFILSSPWGTESGWESRTLVADLFGFRDGGDRFYNITDRALMQPRALSELIEIIYHFLKLGYKGKFSRDGGYESDRLIDRLEAALKLIPMEEPPKILGRPVDETPIPVSGTPAKTKYIWAGCSAMLILVCSWTYHEFDHYVVKAKFTELRIASQAHKAQDFIFSSVTGQTEVRDRK
ncbi:type IVB secretion system protein IcmH/DotU [Flexibacterium corallicola]|uniref:type IVB secretion system protein IcmH/DotU n=1 Tax=Flexibacterium corallicola TaxID=3037259 RepID=UPI00286F58E1|nr:type IVB secretion system protein IcmH/DotU [Pseudovibrio sp. M1P-2-3]